MEDWTCFDDFGRDFSGEILIRNEFCECKEIYLDSSLARPTLPERDSLVSILNQPLVGKSVDNRNTVYLRTQANMSVANHRLERMAIPMSVPCSALNEAFNTENELYRW